MTTDRKATTGGRWADTKEMEREASNSNLNDPADESTVPLNQSTKSGNTLKSTGKQKPGRSKTGYVCRVRLLDGNEFDVVVPTTAVGQVLFDKVCEHIALNEKDYFSLSYRDRADIKFWLNHTKKISKQVGNGSWIFSFEVKFYPTEPESMHEDFTRYLLFLQLRLDILSGRLPCSFVTHALLASYAAQSDLGDYDTDDHGSGFDYVKAIEFAPNQGEELLEKVAELHKIHRGLMPEEAELDYLNNAKKLAMYGIELHPAKDEAGEDVVIGVCASGLMVYKGKLRIHRFSWPKILKIAYKRNNFYINVRPGEFEQVKSRLVYKCANYTMAKKLWKIAVEHHGFFRLKEPEPPAHAMFPLFGSKFRYSGKTQYQSRNAPNDASKPSARVDRSASRRFAPARPIDTSVPTYSTERKEEIMTSPEQTVTTLNLRNQRKQPYSVPFAAGEDDPNFAGDDGQVSLMRKTGSPNYSQAGWSKGKSPLGGGPVYQGTPWDQQGFQLCDVGGRPIKKNHVGPIYVRYGTPVVQSEQELRDMYGQPIPYNYDGHVYDPQGNKIAESPDELYNRYGNTIKYPGHKGPVFGVYGKPLLDELYDGEHRPVRAGHDGPVYDKYGNPVVPVEIVYGRGRMPPGYDASGYQLCDEYGYPLKPSHDGRIYIKYGVPIARGVYELCDINGVPIGRNYDGPVYDRWGNMVAPGQENLYDEYGNPINNLAAHQGPVFGRYGAPIYVEMYDKDGRPIRPGHRGQVYDMHRQILIPLEPSEGEDGLPPYQDKDRFNPYSVTTTTRTTTRTYRNTDGTLVTEHKTEKDGFVETRIEKKTTIVTQVDDTNEIDFDKLLSSAIAGVTELNPDLAVEKIEIRTEEQ